MNDIDVIVVQEDINISVTPTAVDVNHTITSNDITIEQNIIDIVVEPSVIDVEVSPTIVTVVHGDVPAHEALADPHPQYLSDSDLATHTADANAHHAEIHDHDGQTIKPDVVLFETPASEPTAEGSVFWDNIHHTLAVKPDNVENTLQVGLEEWVRIKNMTGEIITNGTPVVGDSFDEVAHSFTVVKALAVPNQARMTGICTTTLAHGEEGFATVRGMVHDMDTSAWVAVSPLYVSDTTAGTLTDVQPISPNYAIAVGFVMESDATTGSIYVNSDNPEHIIKITDASTATKDPTGFNFSDDIAITYDSTNRTITLVGDLRYSWRGSVLSLVSPWTSSAHSNILDTNYYLYTSDGINFTWETNVWEFSDVMIAAVWYGTSEKYALRETHGLMGWQTHEEFHQNVGTYKRSGGTLTNYVLSSTIAANRRPIVAETMIKDEDLVTIVPTLTSSLYSKLYLTSTGVSTFTIETADIVPLLGNNPYWNQFTGGVWQQTLMANNSYMCIWLVATPMTSDIESQKLRYIWLQGQSNGSLTTETNLTPLDLNLGQLTTRFTEFSFIVKLVLRYQGGNWSIYSITNLTGNKASIVGAPAGSYLSIVSHDTNLTGSGTPTDPLGLVSIPTVENIYITGFNNQTYKLYIDEFGNIGTELI